MVAFLRVGVTLRQCAYGTVSPTFLSKHCLVTRTGYGQLLSMPMDGNLLVEVKMKPFVFGMYPLAVPCKRCMVTNMVCDLSLFVHRMFLQVVAMIRPPASGMPLQGIVYKPCKAIPIASGLFSVALMVNNC